MKKILTLSLFVLPFFSIAQFNKGQVYVGGTLSASLQNTDASTGYTGSGLTKSNTINASPAVGFFLSPKVAVGGTIGYGHSFQEYDFQSFDVNTGTTVTSFQKNKNNGVSIGAIARYFVPLSTSVYFALHEQLSFTRSTSETVQGTSAQETTTQSPSYTLGLSVRPVLIFFPSPHWGIEAGVGSVGYSYIRVLPDQASTNTFTLSAGSFSFGLAYYFIKK